LLFWVDGFTNISAALLMWALLKPVAYKPVTAAIAGVAPALPAHRDKSYLRFVIVTTFFAACFFQLFTNLPVYFKNEVHLSEQYIGLIMAANGILIALFEMVLVYKLEGKKKSMSFIVVGVFLTGVSFLMLNLPGMGPLLAFSMIFLVTFGEIFALPFMNSYWISRTQPSNRGQYAAMYTMAWSAAQTLGPMGAAQLAQHAGFDTLWWIVGGLCILASFAYRKLNL
jgi:predicted MFS family arabinose efflux permease